MALNQGLSAHCSLDNQYQNFLASFYLSTKMLMANFFQNILLGDSKQLFKTKTLNAPKFAP